MANMKGFAYYIVLAALIFSMLLSTACAQIIGIKRYKGSDGSVMDFTTGIDIGASLNQVDTVHNERGIKPAE